MIGLPSVFVWLVPVFVTAPQPSTLNPQPSTPNPQPPTLNPQHPTLNRVQVFAQMKSLLHNASTDAELRTRLHGDGVVFFLHLLGLDMNGHAHRPQSKVTKP